MGVLDELKGKLKRVVRCNCVVHWLDDKKA